MIHALRQAVKSIKSSIRKLFPRKSDKISKLTISLLSDVTCIDIGASYYPHPVWNLFCQSPHTTWLAIDPNAKNLSYLKHWSWAAKSIPISEALSEHGNDSTLYITNVDSGSSLLKPKIEPCMEHRTDASYFFPLVEKQIQTCTLNSIIQEYKINNSVLIKLDTQGTELFILRGLSSAFIKNHVICIELESTLLAQPFYEGSPRFFDCQQYLENLGFELAYLNPIGLSLPKSKPSLNGRGILNECDAVFLLRPDLLKSRPLDQHIAMLGCYIAYQFYSEALHLTRQIIEEQAASELIDQLQALKKQLL